MFIAGDFVVSRARFGKTPRLKVQPKRDRDGFKTRAGRLCTALNLRWVHREGGYVCSARQASRFVTLFGAGWDANVISGDLIPPKPDFSILWPEFRFHALK